MEIMQIAPSGLKPSADNPRKDFNPADHAELTESVAAKGIQDPLLIRPMNGSGVYEIVDGERRWRVATQLNLETVPCYVRAMDDSEARDARLISHLQRKNLHPMEEAHAFNHAIESGKYTQGELAIKLAKPHSYIAQRLKLLDLTGRARAAYSKNTITLDHATLLAKMTTEDQDRAMEYLIETDYGENNKLVEIAKDIKLFKAWIVDEISLNLSVAPFDTKDSSLIPGVPACLECPKNSGFNTALFPELNAKHVCGDRICFKAKVEAHLAREKKRVRKEEKRPFIMISKGQLAMDDPLKVQGVKMDGRYKIVKPGSECDDTKRAQWIDGPSKGKFTLVCNYSKCKKHWGGSGRSAPRGSFNDPKENEKRERAQKDQSFRRAVELEAYSRAASAILEKTKGKFDEFSLKALTVEIFDIWGWDLERSGFEKIMGKKLSALERALGSMKVTDLERVNLAALLFKDIDSGPGNLVNKYAKHLKIDVQGYLKVVEAELHRCEVCGCSEITACDGGCSWDPGFITAGRNVCSNCTAKAKAMPPPEASRKTTGKKSKAEKK
jgi:ParB family chromosome partitioning protein